MTDEKLTHVECDPSWPTEPLGRVNSVLTEGCGSVEAWDFSLANSSYEARVYFVTRVASICYGNPKALSSINLFNRLEAESHGLPSSSYEFVPVLLSIPQIVEITKSVLAKHIAEGTRAPHTQNVIKFGEFIHVGASSYLLTNLRALIADVGSEESLNYLNTSDEEIQIIRDNFKVFLFNVDLSTRAQMVRHRCSWQELSRRYVSGKKQPFDFYVSNKMNNIYSVDDKGDNVEHYTDELIARCLEHYDAAIASGIKPEEARRILPQAMMTTIWGAFQPTQLANFFALRLHKTAQREIQQTAQAMHDLIHAQNE